MIRVCLGIRCVQEFCLGIRESIIEFMIIKLMRHHWLAGLDNWIQNLPLHPHTHTNTKLATKEWRKTPVSVYFFLLCPMYNHFNFHLQNIRMEASFVCRKYGRVVCSVSSTKVF